MDAPRQLADEAPQRLAALLGAIPDLWFVIDAGLRYAEVSDPEHPALSERWALKQGRHLDETLQEPVLSEVRALIAAAHATGRPQSHVCEMRTRGGGLRAFEGRFLPMRDGRTLNLVRDVSELVELERRFRAMADAAPVAIFMTDPEGGCTYTNEVWQRLYGLDASAAAGPGWAQAIHPDDRALVYQRWLQAASGAGHFELEFRLRRPDGGERRVGVRSNPIRAADGRITGHVGSVVDLTQAQELEEARRARAVAEEAGRRQAAFMSRVSHELRTPLNAILGFAQLLQQSPGLPPERAQAFAGHVVQAGEHMLALVDDLLELQRLEQGRVAAQPRPLQLAAVLNACTELLAPPAQQAGAELVVALPQPVALVSDERWLRQILLNLGSNAIRHGCPPGRPARVAFAARKDGGWVEISVADEGPGIPAERLQRLFQPFERLGPDACGQPGSSLGLVITRHLAQLLGGEVAIHSEPGRGTRALVRLPAG